MSGTRMKIKHYREFLASRFHLDSTHEEHGEIIEGRLTDRASGTQHPIVNGIPRFVPAENYAANFGLQWNKFRSTQLDSATGLSFTFNSFWNNTRWKPRELYGKTVLEAGSGAGRFTEVLLEAG